MAARSGSFIKRLPKVVEWAKKRGIERVMVLLCLEHAYSQEAAAVHQHEAECIFNEINLKLKNASEGEIDFSFISRKGFLQKNIKDIAEDTSVVTVFVGQKILDFRLEEIKKKSVPLGFVK